VSKKKFNYLKLFTKNIHVNTLLLVILTVASCERISFPAICSRYVNGSSKICTQS